MPVTKRTRVAGAIPFSRSRRPKFKAGRGGKATLELHPFIAGDGLLQFPQIGSILNLGRGRPIAAGIAWRCAGLDYSATHDRLWGLELDEPTWACDPRWVQREVRFWSISEVHSRSVRRCPTLMTLCEGATRLGGQLVAIIHQAFQQE